MKKIVLILAFIILLSACTVTPVPSENPEQPMSGGETFEETFEEKLEGQMPTDKNVVISPYSINMALMLAANGAAGDTREELLEVLGVSDLDEYNAAAQKTIQDESDEDIELNISNSIWLNNDTQPGVVFSDIYKEKVENYFEATAGEVDGRNAVSTINSWVEDKTGGKIKDILEDSNFLAVLVNAIYFKGEWVNPFESEMTKSMPFKDASGKTADVDFMNQTESFRYYEEDGFQMLEMRYRGKDVSMYVFLPQEGKTVTQANINKAIEGKKVEEVEVSIPKFKTEFDIKLKDTLMALGVETAFNPSAAEFKDMFDNLPYGDNVWIDDVVHKAFIEVNEEGTEAAAATAVLMYDSAMLLEEQPKVKVFNANHPFRYIIRNNVSGDVYFSGHFSFAE